MGWISGNIEVPISPVHVDNISAQEDICRHITLQISSSDSNVCSEWAGSLEILKFLSVQFMLKVSQRKKIFVDILLCRYSRSCILTAGVGTGQAIVKTRRMLQQVGFSWSTRKLFSRSDIDNWVGGEVRRFNA
ncbi:hypothetical protein QN277_006404 [Acacia crassicarpa]|uniref:Uncharacterized protein n=1 Tax=Acacia crassicarpa TaxID=499986 RepID=A0AAE1M7S6_9FABA|nr:hypothetical protein QN277_006404 [Acacia crassicarpa]